MNVLVTGTKGRLVTYFRGYVEKNIQEWNFDFISLRNNDWKKLDLSGYDSIMHIAGITAAINDDYEEFYRVNVEKTKELFSEVVRQRVRHFVYLSSMAVYDGSERSLEGGGMITAETEPKQKTNYGKSKFEAEESIRNMKSAVTRLAIVRTSPIVGGGAPSRFERYVKFANFHNLPIPQVENKRSFVYIDSLIDFMCNLVEDTLEGLFFPQSLPQLTVSDIMVEVCNVRGVHPKVWGITKMFIPRIIQNRVFSQIYYDTSLSKAQNVKVGKITSREAIQLTLSESNYHASVEAPR